MSSRRNTSTPDTPLVIGTSSEADGLAHHRPAEDHLARVHRIDRRRAGIVEHELERRAERSRGSRRAAPRPAR
jgi:hypothetical protein